MCRVILTSREDFDKYDKRYGVLRLMQHLERECGGHGNGYALIHNKEIIAHKKGVKLTNAAIYADIVKEEWNYLIWHTRIKSSGMNKDNESCHPFVSNNDCIAMNGTEWEYEPMAMALGIIDTQVIFKCIAGLTLKKTVECLSKLDSVFIGAVDGKPYVVKADGTLYRWGTTSFHASTFPRDVKNTKCMAVGYIWANGKVGKKGTERGLAKQSSLLSYKLLNTSYGADTPKDDYEQGYEDGYNEGLEVGNYEGYNQALKEYALGEINS